MVTGTGDAATLVEHHAADRFPFVHQVEGAVDTLQRHRVRDERVDLDLAVHVPVDDPRHVGAAARAAERGALPDAAGDELERAGADLLPRAGHADDHRHAPAAMAALERLAHEIDVADALETVVGAAAGDCDDFGDDVFSFWIDEMRQPEFFSQFSSFIIRIYADDHVRAGHPGALNDIQADAAEAEHRHVRAGLHLRRVDDGADAGGDAAADVAHLVERRVVTDLGQRDLRQYGEVGERRAAHIVVDGFSIQREP